MHLGSVFGDNWFSLKAEAFARFFGTPIFLVTQTVIVAIWIGLNIFGVTKFDDARIEASTGLRARTSADFEADTVRWFLINSEDVGDIAAMLTLAMSVGFGVTGVMLYMFTHENLWQYAVFTAMEYDSTSIVIHDLCTGGSMWTPWDGYRAWFVRYYRRVCCDGWLSLPDDVVYTVVGWHDGSTRLHRGSRAQCPPSVEAATSIGLRRALIRPLSGNRNSKISNVKGAINE